MADYSRYKTETLRKMRNEAQIRYDIETRKTDRSDQWGAGMRYAKLPQNKAWEKACDRLRSIEAELDKRLREERSKNE